MSNHQTYVKTDEDQSEIDCSPSDLSFSDTNAKYKPMKSKTDCEAASDVCIIGQH